MIAFERLVSYLTKLYFAGYIPHCNDPAAMGKFDLGEKLTGIKLDILIGQKLMQELIRAIGQP